MHHRRSPVDTLMDDERSVRLAGTDRSPVRFGNIPGARVLSRGTSHGLSRTILGSEGPARRVGRFRDVVGSVTVGLLLFSVVASTIAGDEAALYCTMLAA